MRLLRLSLADVRNYASLEFEPEPGLNVLLGPNAQGKSNLLEAIALLGTGKSFRTSREAEMVRWGTPAATVAGEAALRSGLVRLGCGIAPLGSTARKTYTQNGRRVSHAEYLGTLRVVTFVPAHLELVGGPPALRRSFLNAALSQQHPAYYAALASYGRALAQKNALLRGAVAPDTDLLRIYDERLIAAGSALILARWALVADLDARVRAIHARWSGGREGELALRYRSNVPFEVPTAEGIAAAFAQRLGDSARAEAARGAALVGPHRDDVEFVLGGRALGAYGSQGQQRGAVLALKIAEYGVFESAAGEPPLLLLDDVLSELDEERGAALLESVASVEQGFISATHPVGVARASVFAVRDGALAAA